MKPSRTLLLCAAGSLLALGLVSAGSPAAGASGTSAGGGTSAGELDCNGYSAVQTPLHDSFPCTEVEGNNLSAGFLDNGYYVGHDEPSLEFLSTTAGSGNSAQYHLTLPTEPAAAPTGSPAGPVWDYQLTVADWFGMVMCDTQSWPESGASCTPDSDSNIQVPPLPSHAGTAYLELQLYPPGWAPFINQISCDQTHWCAALTIDSLQANYDFSNVNPNCEEPVNFAFLTSDGKPIGPPGPDTATAATFDSPVNSDVALFDPGDQLTVTMHDTPAGLFTGITDTTTGAHGEMVASRANGFRHITWDPVNHTCVGSPYSFHPMYSTAAPYTPLAPGNPAPGQPSATILEPQAWAGWSAHTYDISYTAEIGHFETPDIGHGEKPDRGRGAAFRSEEGPCFTGPTIPGCLGSDIPDFDGFPYRPDWPDSTTAGAFPAPTLVSSPASFDPSTGGYDNAYPEVQFEADLPRIEAPDSGGSCDRLTGAGCTNPPPGAQFYPWFHTLTAGPGCAFTLGNDIPGQQSDFGGEVAAYGPLEYVEYNDTSGGTKTDNFASGALTNPCP